MHEPLGASQVLSYIYELSSGYQYHLLSLEKPEDFYDENKMSDLKAHLQKKNIYWHPVLYKTDRIGKIFNFFRLLRKTAAVRRKYKIQYAHCRSYFPAFIAYLLRLTYLFDTRGFEFDERADIGSVQRGSLLFRLMKNIEKRLYKNAAGVNKLSHEGKRTIRDNELFVGGERISPITVIPTCVDLQRFHFIERAYTSPVKIGYVGTAVGWYDFDKTLLALAAIGKQVDYHFTIFNGGQHAYIRLKMAEHNIPEDKYHLEKVSFQDMPDRLSEFDIALFYIQPYFSKRASAATKLGELFASGIPVLTNAQVGDHEYYINNFQTGQILDFDHLYKYDFVDIFKQLRTVETALRCRDLAEQSFSVQKGVQEYKNLYKEIFK